MMHGPINIRLKRILIKYINILSAVNKNNDEIYKYTTLKKAQ